MLAFKQNDDLDHLRFDYDDDHKVLLAQDRFLLALWDGASIADCPAYGALFFINRSTGVTKSEFVKISDGAATKPLLDQYNRWRWDMYFSPNMYREENRFKASVHGTMLAWCDVDDADPYAFKPHPSVIWETSADRYQALWLWDKKYSAKKAETYSRWLTYNHGGDKNGWPCNKLLRLPGSINHKPKYGQPFVRLLHSDGTPIKKRPKAFKFEGRNFGGETRSDVMNHLAHNTSDVLKKYRVKLNPKVTSLMRDKRVYGTNRSAQVFHMIVGLHEARATLDEIASVIWASPYFQSKHPQGLDALHIEISRILSKQGAHHG